MTNTREAEMTAMDKLRAELLAAGWTAESPATLGADAERMAREERQDA